MGTRMVRVQRNKILSPGALSIAVLSSLVATSHVWLQSTCNVASPNRFAVLGILKTLYEREF